MDLKKKTLSNIINNKVQTDSVSFLKDEAAQGMVEYGLILGLVALVSLMVITSLGSNVYTLFFKDLQGNINTNT